MTSNQAILEAKQAVAKLAVDLSGRGWMPATSGNLSVRVDGTTDFCITPSGVDKGALQATDVLLLDLDGTVLEETRYRPSAETIVHQKLYASEECGSVLHVHTVYNNMVSQLYFNQGHVEFADHELLKALGHWESDARIALPIVENHADLQLLGQAVAEAAVAGVPGVLVRNHGIYAFGKQPFDAKRHLEAFEFLFEYHVRMLQLAQVPLHR